MNEVKATIIEVKGKPYKRGNSWYVEVRAGAYGACFDHVLMFKTRSEAEAAAPGRTFMC